jgi:hypothetical protein
VGRESRAYSLVAGLVAGGALGALVATPAVTDDSDAVIRRLRHDLSTERTARVHAEGTVRTLEMDLRQLRASYDRIRSDPMRIGRRGYEPLVAIERIGRFFYRCADRGMKLVLVEDDMSATVEIEYTLPKRAAKRKTLHPGARLVTPVINGPSSWTIEQATEPKTVTASVEVGPPAGACYLAPEAQASVTSRSHDKSVTQ